MLLFIGRGLRRRRLRAGALALGVLIASVSFVLLVGGGQTSALRVKRTVRSNFRGAYDILVRPRNSFTPLEQREGLVRDNYLSGIFGGITLAQDRKIERLPGVEVAAPIANIAYMMIGNFVTLPMRRFVTKAKNQLFRVRWTWVSDRGLSRYPASATYLYYNPAPPPEEEQVPACIGFEQSTPHSGPFDPGLTANLGCSWPGAGQLPFVIPPESQFFFQFPVLLAAVDPVQEARLMQLDRSVVRGRYLSEGHGLQVLSTGRRVVSALVSTRTYLGDRLVANVELLRPPPGTDVRALLSAGACRERQLPCPEGATITAPAGWPADTTAYSFLAGLPGQRIATRSFDAQRAYGAATTSTGATIRQGRGIISDGLWTTAPSRYRTLGKDRLAVLPTSNPQSIWRDPLTFAHNLWFWAPPQNKDTQFRGLREAPGLNRGAPGGALEQPFLRVVGRFDPERLPGFSPLSRLPQETYYSPELVPADQRSRTLLRGQTLLPTQNLGGYIEQPPLLLTSLDAVKAFTNPHAYSNVSATQRRAPISVIRVRVSGVTGPNRLSRERINAVAQLIHEKTGLDVDITAGSSPHPLTISLPAGKFGRPGLQVQEGWVKKGTSVRYLRALDRKDLALFLLVLAVTGLFLANAAFAAVRSRRAEIGILRTLGWSGREIFTAVLGEVAAVGLAAGVVGVGLALLLLHLLSLHLASIDALYVLPIAVALAVTAGALPAWRAARTSPLEAIRPAVTGPRHAGHVAGVVSFAAVNLTRLPARTLIGASGLALGVAALTFLIGVERAFKGILLDTVLGHALIVEVRTADLVAVALTIVVAALASADVLYLNLSDRRPELVTLETAGWSQRELAALVAAEALLLGVSASIGGAVIGVAITAPLLGIPLLPLVEAAGLAACGGTAASILASLAPLSQLRKLAAPVVLADQ